MGISCNFLSLRALLLSLHWLACVSLLGTRVTTWSRKSSSSVRSWELLMGWLDRVCLAVDHSGVA